MNNRFFLLFLTYLAITLPLSAVQFKICENQQNGITIASGGNNSAAEKISGPVSARILGKNAWIADSLASRLVRFDQQNNSMVVNLKFPQKPELIGDFAFSQDSKGQVSSVWVVDLSHNSVVKFNPRGEKILSLGPKINEKLNFSQIKFIEVDQREHLFVADEHLKRIFEFAGNGNIIKSYAWSGTAFCFDQKGNLVLAAIENEKWSLNFINPENGKKKSLHLAGLSKSAKPAIWGTTKDKIVISAWSGGVQGNFIAGVDPKTGKISNFGSIGEMPQLLRFLTVSSTGKLFSASENYATEEKCLRLIEIDLEGEAEG